MQLFLRGIAYEIFLMSLCDLYGTAFEEIAELITQRSGLYWTDG